MRLSTSEFCGTEEQQWSCLQVHVYCMMARQLIRHAHCSMLTIVSMAAVWPGGNGYQHYKLRRARDDTDAAED